MRVTHVLPEHTCQLIKELPQWWGILKSFASIALGDNFSSEVDWAQMELNLDHSPISHTIRSKQNNEISKHTYVDVPVCSGGEVPQAIKF